MPEGHMDTASPWGPDQHSVLVQSGDQRLAGKYPEEGGTVCTGQKPLLCTLTDQNPISNSDQTLCKAHLVPSGGSVRPVLMPFQDGMMGSPRLVPTAPASLPPPSTPF